MLPRRRLPPRSHALAGAAFALTALLAAPSAWADISEGNGVWWGITTAEVLGLGAAPLIAQPQKGMQIAGTMIAAFGVPTAFGVGYLAHHYEWNPAPAQAIH